MPGHSIQFYPASVEMPQKGWNAFRSYRKRRTQRANRRAPATRSRFRANAPAFVPSWLKKSVNSASRVVSNGINSLLREINTRRRRSLGNTRRSR